MPPKSETALTPKPDAAARKALRIARLKKTLAAKRRARLAGKKPKKAGRKARVAKKTRAVKPRGLKAGGRRGKEMLTLVEKRPGVFNLVKNATMTEICLALAKGKKVLTVVEYTAW